MRHNLVYNICNMLYSQFLEFLKSFLHFSASFKKYIFKVFNIEILYVSSNFKGSDRNALVLWWYVFSFFLKEYLCSKYFMCTHFEPQIYPFSSTKLDVIDTFFYFSHFSIFSIVFQAKQKNYRKYRKNTFSSESIILFCSPSIF